MDRRFLLFLLLATALLWANLQFVQWMKGPQDVAKKEDAGEPPAKTPAEGEQPQPKTASPDGVPAKPAAEVVEEDHERRWVTLGSADPDSPYRMLVVLNSRGAAVEWAGLNSKDYLDLDALFEKHGFLGYLALTQAPDGRGAVVNVVGPGSSAAGAGIQPRDIITSITGPRDKEPAAITHPDDIEKYLKRSRYGETVEVRLNRNGIEQTVSATLGRRPLELLKPEGAFDPPLSFLLTLAEVDRADGSEKDEKEAAEKKIKIDKDTGITWAKGTTTDGALIDAVRQGSPADKAGLKPGDKIVQLDKLKVLNQNDFRNAIGANEVPTGAYLDVTFKRGDAATTSTARLALPAELDGVRLYDTDWEIVPGNDDSTVEFRRAVPSLGLEVVKRYTLAKKPLSEGPPPEEEGPEYHLTLDVELKRTSSDGTPLKVAYQIDGPQGLPTEGWWYATKISRTSSAAGARDVVYNDGQPRMYNCPELGQGVRFDVAQPTDGALRFASVDGRYFAVAMMPQTIDGVAPTFHMLQPLVVGQVNDERAR